jgi:hypothetical protein
MPASVASRDQAHPEKTIDAEYQRLDD